MANKKTYKLALIVRNLNSHKRNDGTGWTGAQQDIVSTVKVDKAMVEGFHKVDHVTKKRFAEIFLGGNILEKYDQYWDFFKYNSGKIESVELSIEPIIEINQPKGKAEYYAHEYDEYITGTGSVILFANGTAQENMEAGDAKHHIGAGQNDESHCPYPAFKYGGKLDQSLKPQKKTFEKFSNGCGDYGTLFEPIKYETFNSKGKIVLGPKRTQELKEYIISKKTN